MNIVKLIGVVGLMAGSAAMAESGYEACARMERAKGNNPSVVCTQYAGQSRDELERARLEAEIDLLRRQAAEYERQAAQDQADRAAVERQRKQLMLGQLMGIVPGPYNPNNYRPAQTSGAPSYRTVCKYSYEYREERCTTVPL